MMSLEVALLVPIPPNAAAPALPKLPPVDVTFQVAVLPPVGTGRMLAQVLLGWLSFASGSEELREEEEALHCPHCPDVQVQVLLRPRLA